jgi:hypothetical protein
MALLMAASGELDIACATGQRYTASDIQALLGTNAGEKIKSLVAAFAMWLIYDRRPDKSAEIPESCKYAKEFMDSIGEGARAFPFQ